jgi:steroid 5-alpha reductase family enzyme
LFRVLKTGSDTRFDDIRSHFFKFLGFWVGQIIWVWTVSLPVTVLNSPGVSSARAQPSFGTGTDIAGVILWALGWAIETLADAQKVNQQIS